MNAPAVVIRASGITARIALEHAGVSVTITEGEHTAHHTFTWDVSESNMRHHTRRVIKAVNPDAVLMGTAVVAKAIRTALTTRNNGRKQ